VALAYTCNCADTKVGQGGRRKSQKAEGKKERDRGNAYCDKGEFLGQKSDTGLEQGQATGLKKDNRKRPGVKNAGTTWETRGDGQN